ncbi:MAG: hypothetical protein H8E46_08985 [FCB group bacterium]|nr:hypothetical protein [FCB group bacterium]
MKKGITVILLVILFAASGLCGQFKNHQLRYPRFRDAYERYLPGLEELFAERGIEYPPQAVTVRIFKDENVLEVWGRGRGQKKYSFIKDYPIHSLSGNLGPKRGKGDQQVPEGFYHIYYYNPASLYHFSVRINYPNKSDRKLGYKENLEEDVYIFGETVSVGSICLSDESMKELYVILVDVRDDGIEKIPVQIFPFKMTEQNFAKFSKLYRDDKGLLKFWGNLQEGYDYFAVKGKLPLVWIDNRGRYRFK